MEQPDAAELAPVRSGLPATDLVLDESASDLFSGSDQFSGASPVEAIASDDSQDALVSPVTLLSASSQSSGEPLPGTASGDAFHFVTDIRALHIPDATGLGGGGAPVSAEIHSETVFEQHQTADGSVVSSSVTVSSFTFASPYLALQFPAAEAALPTNVTTQSAMLALPSSLTGGLTFTLTDVGGVGPGTQALAGFQAAAALWSGYLGDAVNVRLNVGFSTLGAGILGSTGSNSDVVSYAVVRAALIADQKTANDATAVASLTSATSLSFYTNSLGARVYDNDGSANNTYLDVNTANLKALGITHDINGNLIDNGSADGSITFNSSFTFDFDPTNGITAGAIDFVGVAFHEIGHALGFVSGVDIVDYYTTTNLNPYAIFSTLDLFRYNGNGVRDLSYNSPAYFSINGGATNLGLFSTGDYHGDGNQASHWKDNLGLGIMDPTSVPAGQANVVTGLDIQAMDAIGWDRLSAMSPGSVTINDVSVTEGDSGTKTLVFTVTRSGGTAAFAVNYATADNSATAGVDYVATSGTLNFAANDTTKTISVTINGDTTVEGNETFFVNLSGATAGATIGDSQGIGTIANDDAAPDLSAYLNMGATSVLAGGDLAIDEYTKNFGGAAAASVTAFYLSTDTTINSSDILLTTKNAASLSAYGTGTSWYDHQAFAVALTGVAAGTYYLGAIADSGAQVSETNEANNVGNVVQITVTSTNSDLAGYLNMGSQTVASGGNLTIDEYTKNFGTGAAGASTTGFYLSTDATVTTADTLLTTKAAASLTGYGTGSGTSWYDHQAFTVALTGIAPGTYYLGAIADSAGQVSETNEANNVGNVVQITVTGAAVSSTSDLIASLNMAARTVAAGGSLSIDEYTKNLGTGNAGATATSFYLSTDATIDTSDTLLTSKSAAALTGYGTGSGTSWYDHQAFSQSLSTGLAAGTYYLGAIADSAGQVGETNEANNVSNAVQITVTTPADLIGNLNMSAKTLAPGASLAIDEYTKNFGNGATAASTTAFYLSTDAIIDTSDMLLATKTAAALTGYGTGSGTAWYDHQAFSVTLSSGLADGTYYLGAIADAGGQIGELNESNNVWNVVQIVIDHTLI